MIITHAFKEIINGLNLTVSKVDEDSTNTYKVLQKDSIQYCNIIEKRLYDHTFTYKVKEKYFLQPRDILIFVKKPYRVGIYPYDKEELKLVVPSNFIILRGIDMDHYSYIFVANYLERFGIDKLVRDEEIKDNLTIGDIEKIELPDISKEKQMSITPLVQTINKRSETYSNILANDEIIVKKAIEKIVGVIND